MRVGYCMMFRDQLLPCDECRRSSFEKGSFSTGGYIYTVYIHTPGDIMADMISSKLFRTGGSVAVRIPAGWMDPALEVTLIRDSRSGRIYLTQKAGCASGGVL